MTDLHHTDDALSQITSGKVKPRPRAYFVARATGLAVLAGGAVVLSIALLSYLWFLLRVSGEEHLLGFGARGAASLLELIPWPLIVADFLLIVGAVLLSRTFRFSYRRPVLALLLIAALGSVAVGYALDRATPLNDALLRAADEDMLPRPVADFYEHAHDRPDLERGVFRGVVVGTTSNTILLAHDDFDHDRDEGTVVVIPPAGYSIQSLSLGTSLFAAGTFSDGVLTAYGIQMMESPGE